MQELTIHGNAGVSIDRPNGPEMPVIIGHLPATPRLRELDDADKKGRAVILPCKPGDPIYPAHIVDDCAAKVVCVTIYGGDIIIHWTRETLDGEKAGGSISAKKIGEKVFLAEDVERRKGQRETCHYPVNYVTKEVWLRLGELAAVVHFHPNHANAHDKGRHPGETMPVTQRLHELKQADENGMVALLPCKPGDSIFFPHHASVTERKVVAISITSDDVVIHHTEKNPDSERDAGSISAKSIGHTVFLTRAVAEAGHIIHKKTHGKAHRHPADAIPYPHHRTHGR